MYYGRRCAHFRGDAMRKLNGFFERPAKSFWRCARNFQTWQAALRAVCFTIPRRSANHFWQHFAQGWRAQIMMRSVTSFIQWHGKPMYVSWGPLWFEKSAFRLTILDLREHGNVINQLYRGVVIQKEIDEMHRARGHVPFDPNCEICQKTRSVSQHRRKNDDGGTVIQLSYDFFFFEGTQELKMWKQSFGARLPSNFESSSSGNEVWTGSSTARPIREWSRFKRTCSAGRGVAFTRERLGEENRMYTRADRNYTQIGNGNFLLVKTNENRDWWYMGRFYLQPCVGSWWKQAMCGQDRNYTRIGNVFNVSYLSLSMYVCMYLSIYKP